MLQQCNTRSCNGDALWHPFCNSGIRLPTNCFGHSDYPADVAKNRAEARAIMEKLGYGPNNRLRVTVSTRNTAGYRHPAVIAIDQMKEI
jgi:hypothetical protein